MQPMVVIQASRGSGVDEAVHEKPEVMTGSQFEKRSHMNRSVIFLFFCSTFVHVVRCAQSLLTFTSAFTLKHEVWKSYIFTMLLHFIYLFIFHHVDPDLKHVKIYW